MTKHVLKNQVSSYNSLFLLIQVFFFPEIRLRIITDEYEQKLKDQEADYSTKLKSISKELHSQMAEKEKQFHQQTQQLIGKIFPKKIL